ncbi:hypothetical protein ACJD0Z_04175 [Flavobacteriaceae bacterium M23B6Z8]
MQLRAKKNNLLLIPKIGLTLLLLTGACKNQDKIETIPDPDFCYVISMKEKAVDTLFLCDKSKIKEITKIVNQGNVSLAILNIKYWLEYEDKFNQRIKIGIAQNRIAFKRSNFKVKYNLEEYVDNLINSRVIKSSNCSFFEGVPD